MSTTRTKEHNDLLDKQQEGAATMEDLLRLRELNQKVMDDVGLVIKTFKEGAT